jgi:hypothetical protein
LPKTEADHLHEMPRFRRERALVAIWFRREDAVGLWAQWRAA